MPMERGDMPRSFRDWSRSALASCKARRAAAPHLDGANEMVGLLRGQGRARSTIAGQAEARGQPTRRSRAPGARSWPVWLRLDRVAAAIGAPGVRRRTAELAR